MCEVMHFVEIPLHEIIREKFHPLTISYILFTNPSNHISTGNFIQIFKLYLDVLTIIINFGGDCVEPPLN